MTPSLSTLEAPRNAPTAGPSVLDVVGRTPLLELPRLGARLGFRKGQRLLAKAEHLNPGGSAKDRIAIALIESAERRGLHPGGTIVEASSGNTGIALAQVAAVRGYRLHVVASEKVSAEKLRLLEALGARVHRTPVVPHGHPDHYAEVAARLARTLPRAFYLDQFHNPASARSHEETTGPELLADATSRGLRLDAFVAGVGTGGTLTGVARYLKRTSPFTRIVLADPEGSVLSGAGGPRPYLVEGIGDDVPPPLYEAALVDEAVTVSDRESFRTAILCARTEGLLVGGSSGTHLAAAARVAKRLGPDTTVATVLPDSGRNYLSTFFDPAWCRDRGLGELHKEVDA